MSDRYTVYEESITAHCCFEYTVLDTHDTDKFYPEGRPVCECFEGEDARLIADVLNKQGSQANE